MFKKNVHNVLKIVLSSIVHPNQSLLAVEIAKIIKGHISKPDKVVKTEIKFDIPIMITDLVYTYHIKMIWLSPNEGHLHQTNVTIRLLRINLGRVTRIFVMKG
jgi:hypothetical protein